MRMKEGGTVKTGAVIVPNSRTKTRMGDVDTVAVFSKERKRAKESRQVVSLR